MRLQYIAYFTRHNGVTLNGYEYRASEGHFDWANGVFICEREGGYIARINSSVEQEFIRDYLDSIEGKFWWHVCFIFNNSKV